MSAFDEWYADFLYYEGEPTKDIAKQAWEAGIQEGIERMQKAYQIRPRGKSTVALEYWNAVEGWVQLDEVQEHFDSVGCGTIYKNAGEGRMPLYSAPSVPEGYVLVPVEPTEKMLYAGYDEHRNTGEIRSYEIYTAMIQAAQEEE